MTFALGRDLGIVMAKGVIIGVICCVTILPTLILAFDKQIEKTKHRPLIKSVDGASNFIIQASLGMADCFPCIITSSSTWK